MLTAPQNKLLKNTRKRTRSTLDASIQLIAGKKKENIKLYKKRKSNESIV